MGNYSDECLEYFLQHQTQLFDEKVVETKEDAAEFLEECMAVVVSSTAEVAEYMEEYGMDAADLKGEELLSASEVFTLPSGKYLIVMA